MISLETLDELSHLKDSEELTQKVRDILSLINDKTGCGYVCKPIIINNNKIQFNLSVSIPLHKEIGHE